MPTCNNDGRAAAEILFNALDLGHYLFLCASCVSETFPRGYTAASAALFAALGSERVLSITITPELRRRLAGGAAK